MFAYLKMHFNILNKEQCFYRKIMTHHEGRNMCGVVNFHFLSQIEEEWMQ